MDIFLSWHGSSSHALAEILREWLRTVLPGTRPWLSSEDIKKGKRWDDDLSASLEKTSYCVVCVTAPDVARSPWVNFEAGAISKYVDHAHVSPLLVGVSPEDLDSLPLSRFQCTRFEKKDIGRLLRSMNAASDLPIENEDLRRNLRNAWKQLDEDVRQLDWEDDVVNSLDGNDENYDDSDDSGDDDEDMHVLDDKKEDILLFVAECNSSSILPRADLDFVCAHMSEHHVRVEHHLDTLVAERYLLGGNGLPYFVTSKGRAYLVENDLV